MVRVDYLLGACVLLAAAQSGSAWWWKKQNCPQQEVCPMECGSGFVIDTNKNGCKVQLCRCKDVCEHFNCPENKRCQKKFQCKRWGGCFVYARCVLKKVMSPTQSPDETTEPPTKKLTVPSTVTTTSEPSTTTTAVPTTVPTTTKTIRTTSGGEAITKKTARPNLCPNNQEPLQGWNCDVTLLRGRPCPTNYRCETKLSGGVAVCCHAPVTTETPVMVTETTTGAPSRSYCSDGKPELAGWNCGRGGKPCPNTHKCLIHPADRYAVCCPIPVPNDSPKTPIFQGSLPICEQPVTAGFCKSNLPRWYFNSASGVCEFFRYGGCDGNANNFSSLKACERSCGLPNQNYCSLPAEVGRCRAAFRRYYYDQTTKECSEFIYGGCEGNGNNFVTIEQCQRFCRKL